MESGRKLERAFFQRNPTICAKELIGCTLSFAGCAGMIVETEAYAALGDPACHTWRRPSAREFVLKHQPGSAYVYLNYGLHWLFNFLVKGGESDGFVLIRALKPLHGIEIMKQRRDRLKAEELCNGPGKLTQSLEINGVHHGIDPISAKGWNLSLGKTDLATIHASSRIGITQAREYPWRFFLPRCKFVSLPSRGAESHP